MKISVFSLFRDSQASISQCLSQLEAIEVHTNASFEYYFYENDSQDNTLETLTQWMRGRKGKLLGETLGLPSHGSTLEAERMIKMATIRNKMANLGRPTDADYCLILDSDVEFSEDIVNDFLAYKDLDFSMLTSNLRQNVPCKMGSGDSSSYYDSLSLFDTAGNHCMTWSSNPFYEEEDRERFEKGEPIEVLRAFGGVALIKGSYFNKVRWASNGQLEHWALCDALSGYGKIYFLPTITPRVSIAEQTWPHEGQVIEMQTKLLMEPWERFLLKVGAHKGNI
tara:strand:+ start:935 stop:1777 length:843 start_codon:yes stop_codon:yes gene_type:complete